MNETPKRGSAIQWVPLEKMRVRTGVAQRLLRPAWVNDILKDFDINRYRRPVVNRVGEWFWIVDGQHGTEAFKQWLGEWKSQKVECDVFHNLTEAEEAALFRWLNHTKQVGSYDKFVTAITAGWADETNIQAIVRLRGLKIAASRGAGAISAVTSLSRIYQRGDDCLNKTLQIAFDGFGDAGLDADMLDGIAQLASRYNGLLETKRAIDAFGSLRGGANALRARAMQLRHSTGVARAQCIAAAAVEVINRGKGGKKLPDWWKTAKQPTAPAPQ